MSPPTAQSLRVSALEVLGPHGDPRAHEALARGDLALEGDVTCWEASHGRVRAHRVVLGLDAVSLARVRAAPAVHDALVRALSAALASHQDRDAHALTELRTRWNGSLPAATSGAYRGGGPVAVDRRDPAALQRALESWLRAVGEAPLVDLLREVTLSLERDASGEPSGVTLRASRATRSALQDSAGALTALEGALSALLESDQSPSPRVTWKSW